MHYLSPYQERRVRRRFFSPYRAARYALTPAGAATSAIAAGVARDLFGAASPAIRASLSSIPARLPRFSMRGRYHGYPVSSGAHHYRKKRSRRKKKGKAGKKTRKRRRRERPCNPRYCRKNRAAIRKLQKKMARQLATRS